MKSYLLLIAGLILIGTMIAACGEDGDDDPTSTPSQSATASTSVVEPTAPPAEATSTSRGSGNDVPTSTAAQSAATSTSAVEPTVPSAVATSTSEGSGGDDPTSTPAQAAATSTAAVEPTALPAEATSPSGDAEAGRQLAGSQCAACHSFDGSASVGPTWLGLYGSEIELESGESVTADDSYISESIAAPGAKIHKGFRNIMPSFGSTLNETQVQDIIAFIKTLE